MEEFIEKAEQLSTIWRFLLNGITIDITCNVTFLAFSHFRKRFYLFSKIDPRTRKILKPNRNQLEKFHKIIVRGGDCVFFSQIIFCKKKLLHTNGNGLLFSHYDIHINVLKFAWALKSVRNYITTATTLVK